jgi:hypothetical protein
MSKLNPKKRERNNDKTEIHELKRDKNVAK